MFSALSCQWPGREVCRCVSGVCDVEVCGVEVCACGVEV